jgi:hypothetical protein
MKERNLPNRCPYLVSHNTVIKQVNLRKLSPSLTTLDLITPVEYLQLKRLHALNKIALRVRKSFCKVFSWEMIKS